LCFIIKPYKIAIFAIMAFEKSNNKSFKQTFVIGRKPLLEALQQKIQMDRVFVQKGATGPEITAIIKEARVQNVPLSVVPVEKINSFTKAVHQGVLGIASFIQFQQLQDVIDLAHDNGSQLLLLMLDGITDVRNIGAIARSAVVFGAHGIIIPDKGVGAINEDAIKTSAGALLQLPVIRVNSLLKTIDELHLNGVQVVGAEMETPTNVQDVDKSRPTCIVLGSEGKGLLPPIKKACDTIFKIPMPTNFESLNVSVAAGIILYELKR
jgi:23S rRNA (guanosine2251-2'-O)-methyltransferase